MSITISRLVQGLKKTRLAHYFALSCSRLLEYSSGPAISFRAEKRNAASAEGAGPTGIAQAHIIHYVLENCFRKINGRVLAFGSIRDARLTGSRGEAMDMTSPFFNFGMPAVENHLA
jgi:hypothetical protein